MENFSEAMKIGEIMKKILAPSPGTDEAMQGYVGVFRQDKVAPVLGITQSRVSDWKKGPPEIERAWQAFMRLFTYCERELGFDPRYPEELKKRQGRKTKLKLNNLSRKSAPS